MNPAGRILSIYDRLVKRNRGTDTPMLKVWAEVFALQTDSPHLEDEVVTCLQALRSEIDLLRSSLAEINVPENLLHPGMTRLRNITSTIYLNAGWNGLADEASRPENRLSFAWANWTLQDQDEDDLPDEELAALKTELESLESRLNDTEMTPYLKTFIQRQIEVIRVALRVYGVQGVRPLETALHQVAGAYAIESSRFKSECEKAPEPAKSIIKMAGQFIERTAKAADSVDKIRRAAEGAWSLATRVGPLLLP